MKMKELPIIQPRPEQEPNNDPNPPVAQCGLCGMIWGRVMNYYCSNSRCPMQSKTTC